MPRHLMLRMLLSLLLSSMALSLALPGVQAAPSGPLNDAFQHAADEFGVPRDLLVAVAYAETHFDDHGGAPSIDNGYGLMHLVDNPEVQTLPQAAALLGEDASLLQTNPTENIRGGAALLRSLADQQRLSATDRQDLGTWYTVLSRYSGASDPSVARMYADEIYQLFKEGVSGQSLQGETIAVAPQPVVPKVAQFQATTATMATDLQYPAALWVPAAATNYDVASRPTSGPINLIIIHVTEGSYSSAINWFQNSTSSVSAHYVIRSSDGQVTQMVHLKDIAWHAGNYDYNSRAIGIEHEAFSNDATWYTDVMYRSSALLVRALCQKYNIPMDRQHIIGHSEVPDPYHPGQFGGSGHHTDPGPYWNWDYYMKLVTTPPTAPVAAVSGSTYFPETKHNLGATFGSYWNGNGGLPVFGYPWTDSFKEQNPDTGEVYTVQYFERQRFELHPENANTPYSVLLGRLGVTDAQSRGLSGTAPFQPVQASSTSSCTYFSQTGHRLCNSFRTYWQTHGLNMGAPGFSYEESLALFGYPISEEFIDPQSGYTVQYFERARFEYHPENAGTQYDVLLGLLGNQVLNQRGWLP